MDQVGRITTKILPKATKQARKLRRKGYTKVKIASLLKSLSVIVKIIVVSSVGSKDTPIVLAPKEIFVMSHLELPWLKLQKRMLIAKDLHFPMLGER